MAAVMLAAGGLSACAASGAAPLVDVPMLPQGMQVSTLPASDPADAVGAPLRSAEISYVTSAAAGIYRRRPSERSATLVPTPDHDGYGVCLRSPAASGGHDHALIIFTRRLDGEPISQVDDDTLVLRRADDTGICRSEGIAYVTARAA
ncbi:MAG: hypothetical protein V7704_16880 [Aurantimonas endophytica]|uniref:Lipoprotein n=1 Tax=Aurantimonas endophytica TaxID=1522175 RepID=A0A7W6HAT8_9HYPH|nr:hypothetical protein [Aurantimonas endophytica]MBB4001795.1 hypothetical protein [Aurantimonas endophytica]MCO6402568.1 hypothetical protein [Aurantimonas endophytica]